jgi:protein transport protein SEC23
MGVNDRFLLPISEAEATFTSILEELQPDPWPIKSKNRPKRATGVALSLATSLLESSGEGTGARILLFIGGACTFGPGQIVGTDFMETIRLHNDLRNNKAKHYKKAVEVKTLNKNSFIKHKHKD